MKETIMGYHPEAIVIDAGLFPTTPIPLEFLQRCNRVVCCDGAANSYLSSPDAKVWRIVGDCDSVNERIKERYGALIRRIPDQETNDQTKAVTYLEARGIKKIAILGATGLREDHTLGNISLLVEYMRRGIEARAYTDYGVFIPANGEMEFECYTGCQVSIFNFGATGMSSEGLRYPIRDFTNWWQGTLNETMHDIFKIRATGDYLVFINY